MMLCCYITRKSSTPTIVIRVHVLMTMALGGGNIELPYYALTIGTGRGTGDTYDALYQHRKSLFSYIYNRDVTGRARLC